MNDDRKAVTVPPTADTVRYNPRQQRVEWRRGDMLIGWCATESVETVKAWLQYWGLPPLFGSR